MVEKLKDFAAASKQLLIWLITPLFFLMGFIWYLLSRNKSLENELNQSRADLSLQETKEKEKVADEKANESSTDYERLRDEYLKAHKGDGNT